MTDIGRSYAGPEGCRCLCLHWILSLALLGATTGLSVAKDRAQYAADLRQQLAGRQVAVPTSPRPSSRRPSPQAQGELQRAGVCGGSPGIGWFRRSRPSRWEAFLLAIGGLLLNIAAA